MQAVRTKSASADRDPQFDGAGSWEPEAGSWKPEAGRWKLEALFKTARQLVHEQPGICNHSHGLR
jgi:hypothetical protein